MTEEDKVEDAKDEAQVVDESNQEAVNAEVADQQEDSKDKQERNFKAARESIKEKDKRIAELEGQIAQIHAHLTGATQKQEADPLSGDEDDWPTKKEVSKVVSSLKREIEELKVTSRYPNAQEIINKYGHEVNPILANAIRKAGDLEAAVEACKRTPSYIRDMMPKQESEEAKKAIENANKAKSAAGSGTIATVAKGSKYLNMSAAERLAMMNQFIKNG